MYRFDVDYIDEEQGIKRIPCDDGDYVLAEDALALQATITDMSRSNALQATITELEAQATITELQAKVEELTASRDYWKNHWEQAYSEQHGSDPALKEGE